MRHYFINTDHSDDDFFKFSFMFKNKEYVFQSCSDVFSKNEVDYGSLVLINSIIINKNLYNGKILDMGCGYGAVSILLSDKLIDSEFTMVDVNKTAVELSEINSKLNNCSNINKVIESNLFENINTKFNHIISNPPIKTGKKLLFKFVDDSFNFLETNGSITLVIKKNLGADSLNKHLKLIFGNSSVIERDRGYYVLKSIKL